MGTSPLRRLLALPAFLFSVFVFYWSLPVAVLLGRIPVFRFHGPRNDMLGWAGLMSGFFGVKYRRVGKATLYRGGKALYLCNHRSWADFFADIYITEGRAALMGRAMVFLAFPVFCAASVVLKGLVIFKRGHIADKVKFNAWLDATLVELPGFLVYPEGHRSTRPTSLPLKRGMMHYGFSRKLPVQLIITRGKEDVMSEKAGTVHFGTTLATGYSQVIEPGQFGNFEEFYGRLQAEWDKLWADVYAADVAALEPLAKGDSQASTTGFDYSSKARVQMLIVSLGSIPLFLAAAFVSWRVLAALLALSGPLQPVVAAVSVAWVVASMWSSSSS